MTSNYASESLMNDTALLQ